MRERYNLPASTSVLINDHIAKCKNLALILDRYPPQAVVAIPKEKGPWLQNLLKSNHIDTTLARSAYQRWQNMMAAIQATLFQATLDWRMVMGLGGESVLETDITLHHLYGLPYIPGSALKGLTRAYLTGEIEGYKSAKEENDNDDVKRFFGTQQQAGSVIFFDAMPTDGNATFAVDIMNPHYPNYYKGSKPPTNDQDPIPITFLTVEKTTFTFAIAPRPTSDEKLRSQHVEDVQVVKGWLQEALQKYGIGGKTSAGYGHFQGPVELTTSSEQSSTLASDPDMQKAENAKRSLEALKESDVAGQIGSYYQQWQRLTSAEARTLLAQAIVSKVRQAKREKASVEKTWYQELLQCIREHTQKVE